MPEYFTEQKFNGEANDTEIKLEKTDKSQQNKFEKIDFDPKFPLVPMECMSLVYLFEFMRLCEGFNKKIVELEQAMIAKGDAKNDSSIIEEFMNYLKAVCSLILSIN